MSDQPDIGWCPYCKRAVVEIPAGSCSGCSNHTMKVMSTFDHEQELALTKQKLEEEVRISNERGQAVEQYLAELSASSYDLKAAQLHIKELQEALEKIASRGTPFRMMIAHEALAKQPDTRALDKALLEAEITALTHAYDSCKPYGIEFSYMITERIDQLSELNKEKS